MIDIWYSHLSNLRTVIRGAVADILTRPEFAHNQDLSKPWSHRAIEIANEVHIALRDSLIVPDREISPDDLWMALHSKEFGLNQHFGKQTSRVVEVICNSFDKGIAQARDEERYFFRDSREWWYQYPGKSDLEIGQEFMKFLAEHSWFPRPGLLNSRHQNFGLLVLKDTRCHRNLVLLRPQFAQV